MDKVFSEISDILKGGPCAGKEGIYLEIFEVILSCTGQGEANQFFSENFMNILMNFTGSRSPYSGVIYKIFINIFSEEDLNEKLCESKDFVARVVELSLGEVLTKNSKNADYACTLLSNLTRYLNGCKQVFENITPLQEVFHKLLLAFTTIDYNSTCSLDQLAMVICNLSQIAEIRNILTQKTPCALQKLVPFMNHDNSIRREGIIGVVHNCSFDSALHSFMLSNEIDILPFILLPLAGPDQFDEEDNDKLPIDLQYLPDTKSREPNPDIRKKLLETLNQLCSTKFGRQFLRDQNTYIILRELHKWEQNESVLIACENVVDILIKTEDEIGLDTLKDVEIPKDLEEKFNKDLIN